MPTSAVREISRSERRATIHPVESFDAEDYEGEREDSEKFVAEFPER